MTDRIFTDVMAILTAIIGLAIFAVLVGQKSKTGEVIEKGGNAFTAILRAAVSPVT
jgi:ABC-type arginine transport system permease subunit